MEPLYAGMRKHLTKPSEKLNLQVNKKGKTPIVKLDQSCLVRV